MPALPTKLTAVAVFPFAFGLSLPASHAAPLAPHRAVYDLRLDTASDRSGIDDMAGRMVYEFDGSACEGYTVKFRFVTRILSGDVTRLTDQRTTTYEDLDNDTFRFVTRAFVDDVLDREVRGQAAAEDDAISVDLEKPEERELRLEAGRFPTEHMLELIEKAKAGETLYESSIYDGSDSADETMTTNAVIGEKRKPEGGGDGEFRAMKDLAGEMFWPVTIAYFQKGDAEGLPIYQIAFKLYENGVTRDLTLDYGEFALRGTLSDLEMFDGTDCD